MKRFLGLALIGLLLAGCGATSQASGPAALASRGSLRGVRYCEILLVKGAPGRIQGTVYNTVGLNDCPDEQWRALDPAALADEFGARTALMNGPRYFLMDSNALQSPGSVATFGGLELREVATFAMPPGSLLGGERQPYDESAIARVTEYVFNAGREIYELTAPDGRTYVMQSYALLVDPSLTEADLAGLGSRLKLPEGWRYAARTLDADYVVRSTGAARVITDDLGNTYQRVGD